MKTPYEVLELAPEATQEDVRARYRMLVRLYHPDRIRREEDRDFAQQQLKEINQAYEVLGDPARRAEYDRRADASRGVDGPLPVASPDSLALTLREGEEREATVLVRGDIPPRASIKWALDAPCDWLTVNASQDADGSTVGQVLVRVKASATGLAAGVHQRLLRVSLGGALCSIPVRVYVVSTPVPKATATATRSLFARWVGRLVVGLAILAFRTLCSLSDGITTAPSPTTPARVAQRSASPTPGPTRQDTSAIVDEAFAALERGEPKEAEEMLTGALGTADESDLPVMYAARAAARYQLGEYVGCVADLTDAINRTQSDEDLYYLYYGRALARSETGNYEGAFVDAGRATALAPDDDALAETYSLRAMLYLEREQPDDAIADLTQAVYLDPDVYEYWYLRGIAWLYKGDERRVQSDAAKALQLADTAEERADARELLDLTE